MNLETEGHRFFNLFFEVKPFAPVLIAHGIGIVA